MQTIAEYKSLTHAQAANTAFGKYIHVEVAAVAVGEWLTDKGEPVYCRYIGTEIVKFGRQYITVIVDGLEQRIRPDTTGVIQFRV